MSATPWTSVSPSMALGSGESITLVDGNTFLVGSAEGSILGHGGEGLYMLDTRVLSRWHLSVDGQDLEGISALANGPFSVSLVGRAEPRPGAESDLAVVRRRHLGRGMREDIELRFFGLERRTILLGLDVGSDFASLFDVKGGHLGAVRDGVVSLEGCRATIDPTNAAPVDGLEITFDKPPTRLVERPMGCHRLEWDLDLDAGARIALCAEVAVRVADGVIEPSYRCGQPVERAIPAGRLASWRSAVPTIVSDNGALTGAASQAVEDLGALRIFDPEHAERVVVAAGAPWFMTLFGRDALITSFMALIVDHQLARGVLATLADAQGTRFDPATEEEPGRILHEVRYDQRTARLLGGGNSYYGTVDATPLFVMLTAELARWSGSIESVVDLLPAVDRAMEWMVTTADRDGDGFLEYATTDNGGLTNQGWKDSWDGVRYADGRVADAPIALCEVQGYAYAAFRGRAELADLVGDEQTAARWNDRADELRSRFEEAFWIEDRGWYAVGLDADKRPIDSLTSNIGHCLWTGIASEERSSKLADHLSSDRMFSGWGLRTLANDSGGFNPLSYHCGSVWPHDTALAVAGLHRYGHDAAAARLSEGLIDASEAGDGRLPELFAGFDRTDLPAPVPYPSSCSPQAWAAASPLLLVRAVLGLEPDLVRGTVGLRPRLPPSVGRLIIDGMPLGDHRVRIEATPDGIDLDGLPEGVEVRVS